MRSATSSRHQMVTVRSYFAWVTPSNRAFHWVDDAARSKAICGAPNRGWRKVLDLKGDEINATAKAKECARCDEAWASESVTGTQRWRTLQALRLAGDRGLTAFEAADHLGHPRPHVIGTRIIELREDDLVAKNGETRPTDTGHQAEVYVITDFGRRVLEAGEA